MNPIVDPISAPHVPEDAFHLRCGRHSLDLSFPRVMGILNVTPDSFSDGGRFNDPGRAVEHAFTLLAEGADILDLGAESTRPGAAAVSAEEEIARLMPVMHALRDVKIPLSVDTMKPEVMRVAIGEGVSFINDINALRSDGALEAVVRSQAGVCLMHMRGEPANMQNATSYVDVVAEVGQFLAARVAAAEAAGIARERICIDPGFGFGKTLQHNLLLVRGLDRLAGIGTVLFGASRKASLGQLTGRPAGERLVPSVAMALLAAERGASILRVHDVAATRDALAIWTALRDA